MYNIDLGKVLEYEVAYSEIKEREPHTLYPCTLYLHKCTQSHSASVWGCEGNKSVTVNAHLLHNTSCVHQR